jgi:hypothetical protein
VQVFADRLQAAETRLLIGDLDLVIDWEQPHDDVLKVALNAYSIAMGRAKASGGLTLAPLPGLAGGLPREEAKPTADDGSGVPLPRYRVTLSVSERIIYYVEAESSEEAEEKGSDLWTEDAEPAHREFEAADIEVQQVS